MIKLVIALLFINSAHAATVEERVNALRDIRFAIHKCGYVTEHFNYRMFVDKIIAENDITKVTCLESKNTEIDTELNKIQAIRTQRPARRIKKREDCISVRDSGLQPYLKRLILRNLCGE